MTGNFRRLQTHSSFFFPKCHSAQRRVFFTLQSSDVKLKQPLPKSGDVLCILFPLPEAPSLSTLGIIAFSSNLRCRRKQGESWALSGASLLPAVCVRVHAHVSLAQGPGQELLLLASLTRRSNSGGQLGWRGERCHLAPPGPRPILALLAPPPHSPPKSWRTGEPGYQLSTPVLAPLPARPRVLQ